MRELEIEIDVQGLEEVRRKVASVLSTLDGRDVEEVLLGGAKIVQAAVKARAPRRKGEIIRAVKARKGRKRGRLFSIAFCAMDRKIAPHAHLAEYGTGPRYQKRPRKYVGEMPAKPYFWPGVEASKGEVARHVNAGIMRLLGRAAK